MIIRNALFKKSAASLKDCPKEEIPEYAFIGRSNVGKSSLINMLLGKKELARTSATPGKTISMNFFRVNEEWNVVDLPGYGYAKRSKSLREAWEKNLLHYLVKREVLINLFVLIDSRIEPQQNDLEFIALLGENGIPFSIVFTKLDKIKPAEAERNIEKFCQILLESWEELPLVFKTSSIDKTGREEMLDFISRHNKDFFALMKEKEKQMR